MDWPMDGALLSRCKSDLVNVFRSRSLAPRISDRSSIRPKGVEYVPFSSETFQMIARDLSLHGGISRVINRGDVATMLSAEVQLDQSTEDAMVYHCRSSNLWEGDLALTVTHIPKTASTFAVLFGTTPTIDNEVISRLKYARDATTHPLLLPGIFAELEKTRQLKTLVERSQINLERTIYELSSGNGKEPTTTSNNDTMELWLDTTVLRDGLIGWKTQLEEMVLHADELSARESGTTRGPSGFCGDRRAQEQSVKRKRASLRIKDCLRRIIHEYEGSIRECSMRVDGMAMATQLSHATTNMDIALDAKRDGKRIRSISIISAVFLPSMFVATIFSTDFFNWFPEKDEKMISPHIWILFVFSACLSLLFMAFYFLLSTRRWYRLHQKPNGESTAV
ncbi:hypothetical protein CSOJ01_13706 [Colletotrichum sojae]|uniref:CorA-like Mg2+ transporter n=1 Tax=Colletotrichum sojae TaxID=2175907 RepID=A0A8H6MJZ6_9PEZI|nr:hypothetical protein CSOJ01_13706 [Colletotrichum sojae]